MLHAGASTRECEGIALVRASLARNMWKPLRRVRNFCAHGEIAGNSSREETITSEESGTLLTYVPQSALRYVPDLIPATNDLREEDALDPPRRASIGS